MRLTRRKKDTDSPHHPYRLTYLKRSREGSQKKLVLYYSDSKVYYENNLIGTYLLEPGGISMTVKLRTCGNENYIYVVGSFTLRERAVFNLANITYNNKNYPESHICSQHYVVLQDKKVIVSGKSEEILAYYTECPAGAVAALVCAHTFLEADGVFHDYFCLS